MTENKNSFDELIKKIKTADNSRKFPVKRDILSSGNFDSVHEGSAKENVTAEDNERSDLLAPMNSYIDDSDSNISCPLQIYSREYPMDFLAVELSSSSEDNSNQHVSTSKRGTSNVPCNIDSTSVNSIVKKRKM